jgi:hypothetical protein
VGKFHDISSKEVKRLELMDFQIGNARPPLTLPLPLKSMGFRHVPDGSSMERLPQSMINAKEC